MKKIITTLVLGLVLLLASCGEGSSNQPKPEENKPVIKTVTGVSMMTWHTNETFMCEVEVTIENDVIKGIIVKDNSYVHTGTDVFDKWSPEIQADYVKKFIGKSVEDIKALKAEDPENPMDHYDGGSVEGCVDAVTGATASSTTIAKAIKDAVNKYLESK